MTSPVRIAVLTDLHAFDPDPAGKPEPSWLRTDANRSGGPKADPFQSLHGLISSDGLAADYLLCCGDLTDKAHPASLEYVWSRVHQLGQALSATVVATAGNHDVDSRYVYEKAIPLTLLKGLHPRFPVDDEQDYNKYWAQNYFVRDYDGLRLLNLNSAAAHGYGGEDAKRFFECGLVQDQTIEKIIAELRSTGVRDRNVLLCHHHPIRNNKIHDSDYSEMVNGDKLMWELEHAGVGDWLVIHGHKHVSRLAYAAGGASSPVILSAGSFSAKLPPGPGMRNEFYMVELLGATDQEPLRGTVQTWMWNIGTGWSTPPPDGGLPANCGFGARLPPRQLAGEIKAQLTSKPAAPTAWEALEVAIPALRFTLPSDMREVISVLEAQNVGVLCSSKSGLPVELQVHS